MTVQATRPSGSSNSHHDDEIVRSHRSQSSCPGITEASHSAYPLTVPIATRRWLNTRDRRGKTSTEPIVYGSAEVQFLAQNRVGRRGDARRKDREVHGRVDVFDDGAIDIGWASKIRHPRWKNRLEKYSEASYRYFRRWAQSIRFEKNEWRQRLPVPRVPKSSRRFSPDSDLLTVEARERWRVDRELDRASSRAQWCATTLWNSDLTSTDDGSGWPSAVGVRKADRLLAVKSARRRAETDVQRYLNRHTSAVDAALAALGGAVRRTIPRPLSFKSPEYWAILPAQLAVSLARREPDSFSALAEMEADGASEIPGTVLDGLRRTFGRQLGLGGGPTLATDLTAALRGQPGDGQRVLEAAAAHASDVKLTTFRKNRALSARRRGHLSQQMPNRAIVPPKGEGAVEGRLVAAS
jgi:hypothetical protein